MMSDTHYDIIIIGGRCAGASLALRLANHHLKILLVDRATFPSLPNVPSAPFIHPGAMRLIDELGISESEYAHPGSRMDHFVIQMVDYFEAVMPISQAGLSRNYFWGIDRRLFDDTLWKHAAQAANVTARAGFAISEIGKDDSGKVAKVIGKTAEGTPETFTADLIVGADGRFSFSARQFGAKIMEEKNTHTSAVYLAEWENVAAYSSEYLHAATSYRTNKNFMILVIPIGENKYHIGTVRRSKDAHFGAQGAEHAYEADLQRIPHLANRLKQAQRVTDVVGMRPIENGYREAFGANWALVGDAVHYKDPSDGQGMYDALLGAKLLAETILEWKRSGTPWLQMGAVYQQHLMDATHAMFLQTIANIKQSLYINVPGFITKTMVRWMINSPEFQTEFLRYLSREIAPQDFSPLPSPKVLLRGLLADMRFKR
jgi:flavin-dependent dehydrogenase